MKTIAFIPVRGGSKSIPLKNIKLFCGKPLVYWNLEALQNAASVDEIIVATDSDEIERVALSFAFPKVKIYRRSTENACDTASTESVMLEYLAKVNLAPADIFMLVQATSPLTTKQDFEQALTRYHQGGYDSMLTCVRNFRFFWNADGTSKNYDYRNRPRRQNFQGELMENGAFYLNTVQNILATGNRLSGKIGIYEMPEYTATEIDEPDDWAILENLMRRHVLSKRGGDDFATKARRIKLFLSDVDGELTDASMYYSEAGDELKRFNTHDGMGFNLLTQAGIKTGIITSENTQMVERRAKKLKIDYLYQGKREGGKLAAAHDICRQMGITLEEVAYVGDDINCLDILQAVGLPAHPANAVDKVKQIPGILSLARKGGDGAVREFIERILAAKE